MKDTNHEEDEAWLHDSSYQQHEDPAHKGGVNGNKILGLIME